MAVDIKQSYRRLYEEAFGNGRVEAFDEICDPAYRSHGALTGDADLRQEKENARMYRTSFPDLKPAFLGTYVDGDTCVLQWRMTGTHQKAFMGIEPTGVRCTVDGISIAKFKAGKIVESWTQWDPLSLLKQLGAAPDIVAKGAGRPEARPHA